MYYEDVIEKMKYNLKSATHLKLKIERQVFKLRNTERSLSEELYSIKAVIELRTEQLQDLKDQIHETSFKVSRIEICKSSEKLQIESRVSYMNDHKQAFDEMFEKERSTLQLRNRKFKQKELEEEEQERQKKIKIIEQNELFAKMVINIEEEIKVIDRECAILKKRNNAIMLKLRRKLVETEDARKGLLKKREDTSNL